MVLIVFETTGAIRRDSKDLIMKAAEDAHYFRKNQTKTSYNVFYYFIPIPAPQNMLQGLKIK